GECRGGSARARVAIGEQRGRRWPRRRAGARGRRRALGGRMADARVEGLIAALTLDEKISLVRGGMPGVMGPSPDDPLGEVGYLPGISRLGIPPLRLTDGPAGVRITHSTTALPAPVALAATFSTELAERYGQVLGHEARAMRQDVIYAPMLNIVRVPQ